jgi:hypothetical protein
VDTFDLQVDAGAFAAEVLAPYVRRVRDVVRSLAPVVEALRQEVPVLSVFESGLTVGDLLARSADGGAEAYHQFLSVYDAIDSFVTAVPTAGLVYQYRFRVASPSDIRPETLTEFGQVLAGQPLFQHARAARIHLDVLEEPGRLVQVILGGDVPLLRYEMPAVALGYDYTQSVPICIGPVPVNTTITGRVSFTLNVGLALISAGIRTGSFWDGLAVTAGGSLTAGLTVSAAAGGSFGVTVAGQEITIASAQVGGVARLEGTATFGYHAATGTLDYARGIVGEFALFAEYSVLGTGKRNEYPLGTVVL